MNFPYLLVSLMYLLFFIALGFAPYYLLKNKFGSDFALQFTFPTSTAISIILLTPFYILNQLKFGQSILIIIVSLMSSYNLMIGQRGKNYSGQLKSLLNFLILILFIYVVLFSFSFKYKFYAFSDSLTHASYLVNYSINERFINENLDYYPPGWYFLSSLFSSQLSPEFIYRFLGPTLGAFCAVGIYFLFHQKNKLIDNFFILALVLLPIPGTVSSFLIFLWPFQFIIFLFLSIFLLIYYWILKRDDRYFPLVLILLISCIQINYYYGVLISSLILMTFLALAFKNKYYLRYFRIVFLFFIVQLFLTFTQIYYLNSNDNVKSLFGFVASFSAMPTEDRTISDGRYNILFDIFVPSNLKFEAVLILIPFAFLFLYWFKVKSVVTKSEFKKDSILFLFLSFMISITINVTGLLEIDFYRGRFISASFLLIILLIYVLLNHFQNIYYSYFKFLTIIFVIFYPISIPLKPIDITVNNYIQNLPDSIMDCSKFDYVKEFSLIGPLQILFPDQCPLRD
jgi:hypothetical protein